MDVLGHHGLEPLRIGYSQGDPVVTGRGLGVIGGDLETPRGASRYWRVERVADLVGVGRLRDAVTDEVGLPGVVVAGQRAVHRVGGAAAERHGVAGVVGGGGRDGRGRRALADA